jgi:hypothetical protein
MASEEITLIVRRSGACCFDINVRVDENPALQDAAMSILDDLLSKESDKGWLGGVYPWSVHYPVGISYRMFSGDVKLGRALLLQWIKICEQKFNKKNVSVEMSKT